VVVAEANSSCTQTSDDLVEATLVNPICDVSKGNRLLCRRHEKKLAIVEVETKHITVASLGDGFAHPENFGQESSRRLSVNGTYLNVVIVDHGLPFVVI
jgi:hypothetical protein